MAARRTTAAIGSALFFAVAPGVVAGLVPWYLAGERLHGPFDHWWPLRVVGATLILGGTAALVSAFVLFVAEGIGTPAPVAPTERLVVGGLNHYVRNPMYLAVVATIIGQALLLSAPLLLAYAAIVLAATASFARWYEEPALRRRFGEQYEAYRRAVPAWWPRHGPRARRRRGVDLGS